MSVRRSTTVLASALLWATASCVPMSSENTTPPDGNVPTVELPPKGRAEDNSLGGLRARLAKFRAKKASIVAASTNDPVVCEELCSLASDICEVQVKLCELSDERPDDEQYQNLCREAKNECQEAQKSCVRCVESNE
ncbi:MAG TPA: hypothetical protein VFG69_05770 [Nannocystaceae bacterium]|nr:hypothetical protein [Nannocystaceae bacterium]